MHVDLLRQAFALAKLDPMKPRQANLRRAVSAAYYSLFHFLVEQACRGVLGAQHDQVGFRRAWARAFEHSTMCSACESFAGGTLPASVLKALPVGFQVPLPLRNVARTFAETQELRHLADYDLAERFTRSEVLAVIDKVESAMDAYKSVSDANVKQFFFVSLATWKTMTKR